MATIKVGYVVRSEVPRGGGPSFSTRPRICINSRAVPLSVSPPFPLSPPPVRCQPIFLISIKTCQKFLAAEIPSNYAIPGPRSRSRSSFNRPGEPSFGRVELKIQNPRETADNSACNWFAEYQSNLFLYQYIPWLC